MKLLIDCGNTRIKWARAVSGAIVESDGVSPGSRDDEAIDMLAELVSPETRSAHVASVLDEEFTARLVARLARAGLPVTQAVVETDVHGLRIAYDDPAALGVDRWLAMIAARSLVAGAVCVVSAGTAVTFDAVAADGAHLGGFIWAGPKLVATALETKTRRIGPTGPASAPPGGRAILGRSTDEAVSRGTFFAIAAAIDRAVSMVGAAGDAPALLLTGGDAARLEPWLQSRATIRPQLVLEGLLRVADAAE